MAGNPWVLPAGNGPYQLYLWAQGLIKLLQQGKHKEYKVRSITLTAGTTTTVSETTITSTSIVLLQPTNATAAALSPYTSAKTPGVSFQLTHGAAAGTETYDVLIIR